MSHFAPNQSGAMDKIGQNPGIGIFDDLAWADFFHRLQGPHRNLCGERVFKETSFSNDLD